MNEKLVQLAVGDYEFRQSIYKNEMAELKRYNSMLNLGKKTRN